MDQRLHHPRARRLKVVLDLAVKDEKQALQRWGQFQQKLQHEQEKQTQLTSYREDYQRHLSSPVKGVITSGAIHNTMDFIGQIETALKSQSKQLAQLERQTETAHSHYMELHAKTQALEKMIQRLEDSYVAQQNKAEQVEADEWVTRSLRTRH